MYCIRDAVSDIVYILASPLKSFFKFFFFLLSAVYIMQQPANVHSVHINAALLPR